MTLENIGWWIMAVLAVVCALGMVTAKNPVHGALWLVANFVSLAVLYLILSAPLLFAVQMIVYAGAIMVLFLFVIMFFMAPSMRQWLRPPLKTQLVMGGVLVVAFIMAFMLGLAGMDAISTKDSDAAENARLAQQQLAQAPGGAQKLEVAQKGMPQYGSPKALGLYMFKFYTLPFELTSILLLAALLGAAMIARDVHGEGREHVEERAAVAHTGNSGEVG
jgi:NADH-quinone oxidoreductase subunit J